MQRQDNTQAAPAMCDVGPILPILSFSRALRQPTYRGQAEVYANVHGKGAPYATL
jgi:hypothetical protein